jgi:hypothetical protein
VLKHIVHQQSTQPACLRKWGNLSFWESAGQSHDSLHFEECGDANTREESRSADSTDSRRGEEGIVLSFHAEIGGIGGSYC